MSADTVFDLIKKHNVEFVDLRFADVLGKQHHVTFPARICTPDLFEDGLRSRYEDLRLAAEWARRLEAQRPELVC